MANKFLESASSFGSKFVEDAGQVGNRFLGNIGEATGITQNAGAMEGLSKLGEMTGLSGVLGRLGFDLKKGGKPFEEESNLPALAKIDKRVKIKISEDYLQGPARVLKPIGGIVFPYTPQIVLQSRASYNSIQPIHSNYAFQAYQHSSLDAISIVGTFTAQDQGEAEFVLGTIHALRTITKMHFGGGKGGDIGGDGSKAGAPPPVVRLDGYGDYIFNNLPVVISSFFFTMNDDVDYIDIKTDMSKTSIPTRAEFTVECLPAFSRTDQASFSLDQFAKGNMTKLKGMI